jgi:hypothetical protein
VRASQRDVLLVELLDLWAEEKIEFFTGSNRDALAFPVLKDVVSWSRFLLIVPGIATVPFGRLAKCHRARSLNSS